MPKKNPLPIRLKEARQRIGISQKELGLRLGLDPGSASGGMNHYEKGRHIPDLEMLQRMADELDVPLHYFFCESEQAAELVCLIEKLSETEKAELIAVLSQSKSM